MAWFRVEGVATTPRRVPPAAVLALVSLVGFGITAYIFSPGYLSYDSVVQLAQALGRRPLSDWHPPVMSLAWRGLIEVTGTIASMALVQEALLWLSLWGISVAIWRSTRSWALSVGTLGLALLPFILNFAGVVWKDVQMAFALLGVIAVSLTLRRIPPNRTVVRYGFLVVGILLLSYATLVRKNAAFALPPMVVLLGWAFFGKARIRNWIALGAAIVAAIALPSTLITQFAHPESTHQVTQVMLDDLLHVMAPSELRTVNGPRPLQMHLAKAAQVCAEKRSLMNAYWTCYGRGANGDFTSVAYPDDIQRIWLHEMPRHISGYLQYRTDTFTRFLLWNQYVFQSGIRTNDLGVHVDRPVMKDALRDYVVGSQRNLPWLFTGAFWLLLNLTLIFHPGPGEYRFVVRLLGWSGALYIFGYFPIVPETDFRYVYWSVIAATVGVYLQFASRRSRAREATSLTAGEGGRHTTESSAAKGHSQSTETTHEVNRSMPNQS